jgi:hypothetical protein
LILAFTSESHQSKRGALVNGTLEQRSSAAEHCGMTIMTEEEKGNYPLLFDLRAAFKTHDVDRIMAHSAEDSSLDMPRGNKPWGARFTGKDAVRTALAMRLEMTPDVHYGEDRAAHRERMY